MSCFHALSSACLVSCWSLVFGSRHSCLEFRFRVGVRTLALRILSRCVSVRSRVRSAARSSVHVCFVVLHAVRVFIGCMLSCCHVLCEHTAYEYKLHVHVLPCACVFVLCEHMAFVLVFCVPCALVSIVLTPPILFPDYWLIYPTFFPRYPPHLLPL